MRLAARGRKQIRNFKSEVRNLKRDMLCLEREDSERSVYSGVDGRQAESLTCFGKRRRKET